MRAISKFTVLSGVVCSLIVRPAPLVGQLAAPMPVTPVLSTSAQGEAKVIPDRASVVVNVQTRATTATAAGSQNAARTRAVLDALGRLGLERDQLATEGYNLSPEMQYERDGGRPRVVGYVATNTVRAETRRPEQAGAIIDAALGAGANLINSLTFYASSIDAARRQAIAAAVASAQSDADAMARAAGGTLGALIELSTNGPSAPPRPMYAMDAMRAQAAESVPTPVNPAPQTVTAFVTGRWQFVALAR